MWLTADVHWAQAIEYPPYGMWEFVGCPIGANPRRAGMPLSPYGAVAVDPLARTMTVDLKLQDGALRHRTVILAV